MAMIHVSNLRNGSICGIDVKDIPKEDRLLAAFIPETQAMINCDPCRKLIGLSPWQ